MWDFTTRIGTPDLDHVTWTPTALDHVIFNTRFEHRILTTGDGRRKMRVAFDAASGCCCGRGAVVAVLSPRRLLAGGGHVGHVGHGSYGGGEGMWAPWLARATAGHAKVAQSVLCSALVGMTAAPAQGRRTRERVQFSAKSGLTGLENLGNTCFVNSIVQCLSHTRALRDYCVRGDYESETNPHSPTKGALAHAFALLLRELWSGGSVARPSSLLTQVQRHAPRFGGGSQHDAQEFLLFLLDGLHHDVNRSSPRAHPLIHDLDHLSDKEKSMKQWKSYLERDNSKIVDLFVGQLKSTLTCLHCGLHSTTFDAFWSLPLPVAKRPLSDPSLQECVRLFAKEETLDGDDRPHCPRCRCKRRSGKRLSLQRLPRLLVLFLKRFSEPAQHLSPSLLPPPPPPGRGRAGNGGSSGGGASKLTAPVNYPLRGLDLTAYAAESNACALYDLYAVSLHSGSMQCGHYVSLCRHAQSGSWYLYNDTSVTEVPESRVVSSEAYILFYELCGSNTHV